MRTIAFLMSVALVVPCIGDAQVPYRYLTPADIKPSGLMIGYRPEEYFSEVYAMYSPGGLLFFQGEPITIRISVGNIGSTTTSLKVLTTNPEQLFQVEAFKAPLIPRDQMADRGWSGGPTGRYRDEVPSNIPLRFSNPDKSWPGGKFELRMERETVLDPREAVEWVVTLPSNLEPALYRFLVRINATDREQHPALAFTGFGIEVRPNDGDAQPEVLRREAFRRLFREDTGGAREAAADLLRIYPNASQAYGILAMIARQEGKTAEEAQHLKSAEAILRAGRDELLLKNKGGRIE